MLAQETSQLAFRSNGSPATVTLNPEIALPPAPAEADVDTIGAADLKWDPLLVAVAAYLLTAVGRVHQLFPVLELLRPAALTGVVALLLYAADHHEERRARDVFIGPTKYIVALLGWMILSTPSALVASTSVDVV